MKRRCKPGAARRPAAVALLVNSGLTEFLPVDAVDLHPLTVSPTEFALGTDVDAWFMALDGRVVARRRRHRHPQDRRHPRPGLHALDSGVAVRRQRAWRRASGERLAEPAGCLRHPAALRAHGVPLEIIKIQVNQALVSRTRRRSAPRPRPGAGARRRRCAAAPRSCQGW